MSNFFTIQSQNRRPSYWTSAPMNGMAFCQTSGQLEFPDGHKVEVVPLAAPSFYDGPVTREQILEERLNDAEAGLAYTKALVERTFFEKRMVEQQLAATQRDLDDTRRRLNHSSQSHRITSIQLSTHKRELRKKESEIALLKSQSKSNRERRRWRKKTASQEQSIEKTTEAFDQSHMQRGSFPQKYEKNNLTMAKRNDLSDATMN